MKSGMKQGCLISDVASVSDEALCIAILENSWDKWIHLYKTRNDTSDDENSQDKEDNEENSPLPSTKWTEDGRGAGAKKYFGWNRNGIDRFNAITALVREDRELPQRSKFEEDFKINNKYATIVQKKKNKTTEENHVEVYDDL